MLHPAPFGSRCRYALDAKAYCKANNLPEKEFLTYVDYDSMPKYTATDEIADELDDVKTENGQESKLNTTESPTWINDLIRINHEQRQQVDNLISKFDSLVTMVQSPTPAHATAPVVQIPAEGKAAGPSKGGQAGIKPETGGRLKQTQHTGGATGSSDMLFEFPPPLRNQPSSFTGRQGAAVNQGPSGSQGRTLAVNHGPPGNHGLTATYSGAYSRDGNPAPADFIEGPLTTALERLSMAIDPTVDTRAKGSFLRPEFHVQHVDKQVPLKNIDHSKLNYSSLIYGMCKVIKYLLATDGDVKSYVDHMIYITKLGSLGEYTDMTFIAYDRAVIDAVLANEIPTFVAGYPIAASLNFHASNMIRNQAEKQQNMWFRGRGRGRGRGNRPRQSIIPDGFPEHICYDFNYKNCEGCNKNHICRICNSAHKAINCPKKREQKDNQ